MNAASNLDRSLKMILLIILIEPASDIGKLIAGYFQFKKVDIEEGRLNDESRWDNYYIDEIKRDFLRTELGDKEA